MNDMAHNYELGQVEHADTDAWGRRAIHTGEGGARWHALRVPVMQEDAAEHWLHLRGVYAFHPIRRRPTTIRGKVVERKKRYLPGYVFARFPGRAIRHRVLDSIFITEAVTMQSGAWAILRPADLARLYDMRDMDRAQEAERQKSRRRARRLAPGDRVRILEGLWYEGQETEVVSINAGRAVVKIHMFGAELEAEADVARLRKIE